MNQYDSSFTNEDELITLGVVTLFIFVLLILVIIRNWYNLYKKRSYRKTNKELQSQIELARVKAELDDSQLYHREQEIQGLQQELNSFLKRYETVINEKDVTISNQQEVIKHQKEAYEKYVNFKQIEANNTKLGAHFIKNVISQIYCDLESSNDDIKSFWGIPYKIIPSKAKQLSLQALKNIFKLLDYNVSAIQRDKVILKEELNQLNRFLELVRFLKPDASIDLENRLNEAISGTLKIKPTLCFTFIENALKHGSLNERDSFLRVVIESNKMNQLSYTVINSMDQKNEKDVRVNQDGFGLLALDQLIKAYYPGSKLEHRFNEPNEYVSKLTLMIA